MLIIPAIDLRDGKCVRLTQGRRAELKVYDGDPVEIARRFEEAGARMLHVVDRIVYTDVARDGTLSGPNLEQTCAIARESGLRVTASGGVSTLGDFAKLKKITGCGVDSVIVGKALYEGRFTLREALRAA